MPSPGKQKGGRYSISEVTALAEGYEELREVKYKPWIHVRLVDLWRAYRRLTREHRQAVLLCGFHEMSSREASKFLDVSHSTVAKRYANGLQSMTNYLNGD